MFMKKKRKICSGILAMMLCLAVVISGCGDKIDDGNTEMSENANPSENAEGVETTEATEDTNAAEEPMADNAYDVENMEFHDVNIHVMTRITNEASQEYFAKKIEEFNSLGIGITVELENITTEEDYLNKLRTAYSSGDTPNIFTEYGGSRVKDYIAANGVLDLTPYLEADTDYYDSFYSTALQSVQYEEYEGIWGLPYQQYIICLFYNQDIFEENNLTPPETWDDLMDVCEKLKAAGVTPFQVGEKSNFRFGHLSNCILYSTYGVDAANRLADGSMQYDGEEMMDVYAKIAEMNEKGYFGEDILSTDYATEKSMFTSGTSAMIWGLNSDVMGTLAVSDVDFNVGVTAMPYGNEQYKTETQGGVNNVWHISTMQKEKEEIDASVYWLKWMTSDENLADYTEVLPNMFGRQFDLNTDDPLMKKVLEIYDGMEALKSDAQSYDDRTYLLDTVRNALQGIALGNTPETCASEIMEQISANE